LSNFIVIVFARLSGRIVKVWWTIAVHQQMQKMCEVASFKNFENSLTTVKVMTKTKVAPFYLGHGVYKLKVTTLIGQLLFIYSTQY